MELEVVVAVVVMMEVLEVAGTKTTETIIKVRLAA